MYAIIYILTNLLTKVS